MDGTNVSEKTATSFFVAEEYCHIAEKPDIISDGTQNIWGRPTVNRISKGSCFQSITVVPVSQTKFQKLERFQLDGGGGGGSSRTKYLDEC
jgi:hypothetical protein